MVGRGAPRGPARPGPHRRSAAARGGARAADRGRPGPGRARGGARGGTGRRAVPRRLRRPRGAAVGPAAAEAGPLLEPAAPAAARRSRPTYPTRPARAGSSPSSCCPARTCGTSSAPRCATGRTRWRWPAGTGHRRSSRRWPPTRPALRVHPGRHAQPLRARPRRGPRRRGRGARRARRRPRATGGPRRGQRPGLREQRLARRLRRGGAARGLPGGEAPHDLAGGPRRARARAARASTCGGPGPTGASTPRAR